MSCRNMAYPQSRFRQHHHEQTLGLAPTSLQGTGSPHLCAAYGELHQAYGELHQTGPMEIFLVKQNHPVLQAPLGDILIFTGAPFVSAGARKRMY